MRADVEANVAGGMAWCQQGRDACCPAKRQHFTVADKAVGMRHPVCGAAHYHEPRESSEHRRIAARIP